MRKTMNSAMGLPGTYREFAEAVVASLYDEDGEATERLVADDPEECARSDRAERAALGALHSRFPVVMRPLDRFEGWRVARKAAREVLG